MWMVLWQDNEPNEVRSLEHLNELLDELAAKYDESNPRLVQIRAPSGEVMLLGMSGATGVLTYGTADGWPSWHSVGSSAEEGDICYYLGSVDCVMPKADAIPRELARKAVEYFYRTRERSPDVMWEED